MISATVGVIIRVCGRSTCLAFSVQPYAQQAFTFPCVVEGWQF
jgi:hypothetical protein